ncbi:MAG: hypothetical protein LUQ17_00380 [Methanomicrobiales archaeon]|nr:hypothetical protein [Methanomicrobiales archaeon]
MCASAVFFTQSAERKLLDAMLGFAGGVVIAASFWSLLASRDRAQLKEGAFPPGST